MKMSAPRRALLAAGLLATLLGTYPLAHAEIPPSPPGYRPEVGQPGKDVVWVPTPQALVDRMLNMAALTPADRLVDLGSGDGRLVITAAQRGAIARGIELNPDLVNLSRQQAEAAGVSARASFEQADIFKSEFSDATIVTLFLLPELNVRLRPTLLKMAPGTRIVSNSFRMGDWEPDETTRATKEEGCTSFCSAYNWVVPVDIAGNWELDRTLSTGQPPGVLALAQTYQRLSGSLRRLSNDATSATGDRIEPLLDARIDGATFSFTIGDERYTGTRTGNLLHGMVNDARPWRATPHTP